MSDLFWLTDAQMARHLKAVDGIVARLAPAFEAFEVVHLLGNTGTERTVLARRRAAEDERPPKKCDGDAGGGGSGGGSSSGPEPAASAASAAATPPVAPLPNEDARQT